LIGVISRWSRWAAPVFRHQGATILPFWHLRKTNSGLAQEPIQQLTRPLGGSTVVKDQLPSALAHFLRESWFLQAPPDENGHLLAIAYHLGGL
jgi:hypothetical protein